jgi:hypothetical protein
MRSPIRFCAAIVFYIGGLTSAVLATSAGQAPTTVADAGLRAELVQLAREDQAAREGLADAIKSNNAAFDDKLREGDFARTRRLKEIVAAHGWPTVAQVGRGGVGAAWLIVQHSPDFSWQEEMLPRLELAFAAGEISRADVALLTDRVLVHGGRPRRYGSSFSVVNGRLVADAIEDEIDVDSRRAAVGLPSMAEYARLLADLYKMPVDWPRQGK